MCKSKLSTMTNNWRPGDVFGADGSSYEYGLVILNNTLARFKNLSALWDAAKIRVTVDGGTNNFFAYSKNNLLENPLPDLITGDFDSIDQDVLEHYRRLGVSVAHTPDQIETDFTKCLREIAKEISKRNLMLQGVVAIVENSGRFDHVMGNIQTLFKSQGIMDLPVFLLTSDSLTWLLQPGAHSIEIPATLLKEWCALIPVGSSCPNITTTGLKWNLNDQTLEFGKLVSTSNTYSSQVVTVETVKPLVWSMGIM